MKLKLFAGLAVLVVGLLVCASSASAALMYFDAQIVDTTTSTKSGNIINPKNTVMCAPGQNCAQTAFTDLPHNPTTNPTGNWTQNGANPIPPGTGTGSDNAWNQRFAANFGNPEPGTVGNGTVYESRGQFGGPNTEDPPVLKTTVNVAGADQGTTKGVYALFWTDQSNWQMGACLYCVEDEYFPLFKGNFNDVVPGTHVFGVYDVGAGDPGNLSANDLEMNGYTTSDAMPTGTGGTNRRLKAAWLGNIVLGSTLTVFVGDGPAFAAPGANSQNSRTWYDGIAYGDVQNLEAIICVPEPTSLVLFGIGLAGVLLRRRS